MDPPLVHVGRVQLRGDPRLKYTSMKGFGNAIAVIDNRDDPFALFSLQSDIDAFCVSVAGITKHFYDDVFRAFDILSSLSPLSFRALQTDEAIPEVVFNPEMAIA